MLKDRANSAAKKTLSAAKRVAEETQANASIGAAAVGRRGSLEGLQPDWMLAKARAAGVPIGGGGSEPEPEAPLVTVGRHHLGEHAERFPRLDGYVEKQQKGASHIWQRRWFVLDGCVVRYYKSSKDVERSVPPLGLIWSHDVLSVRQLDGADHQRTFLLEAHREEKPDKPRVFTLRAATDELVSRWVESLDRSRRLVKEVGLSKDALLAAAAETAPDASSTAAAPRFGASEQAGYLFKQNPRGIWQKRWCVLSNGQLLYKATKTAEQSNAIALQTCRSIQKDSANKAGFNIDTGDRVFKLMADSDADADEWVDLLQRSWSVVGGDSGLEQDCELVQQWDESIDAVQAGIEATFARIFAAAATAEDVASTLDAAELVLLEIIGVHTQLAAAGHFARNDIAEFHASAYHSLIHARLSETVSIRPDPAAWAQVDALRFIVWCGEYHTRMREVTSLDLAEPTKLTELSIVPTLTDIFTPGLEIHAQKRSPKGGGKLQVWQKRWFVLHHCRLTYYKSRNDDEPLGSILLSQVSSIRLKQETNDLKMVVAGRKTVMRFESSEDATTWMRTLEQCRQIAAVVESIRHGNAKVVSKVAVQYDSAAPGQLSSEIDIEFLELEGEMGEVIATLDAAESITDTLTVLLDDVATCQPPREDIAQFYVEQYHRRLYGVICSFLTASALEAMEAKHILLLVGWVYNYHDRVQKLGGQVPPEVRMTAIPAFQQVLEHVPKMSGVLRKLSPRAKRGVGIKGWQKRHFVLENCILKYYKTEPKTGDELAQGEIRMDQLKSLTLADSHGSLGMKLAVAGRVYYLMAENEAELRRWVDAIERSTLRGIVQAVDYDDEESSQDAQLVAAEGGGGPVPPQPARQKREPPSPDAVSESFETIFEPRNGYAEEVEEDLSQATSVVLQLASVLDRFVFEQVDDAVVDELATRCHQCVVRRIEAYLGAIPPEAYEQGITHSVLSWMSTYHDELEQQAGSLTPVLFELECVQPLCAHYRTSMLATMTKWCKNLIQLERESVDQIEHSEEEGLFTGGPVDLFTMVNQQIAAAHSTGVDQLTFNVLLACEAVFGVYVDEISQQVTKDWQTMPLEFLCAVINNCSRMMEHVAGLAEQAELLLSEKQMSSLAPDAAAQGFLGVAKTAITAIVDQMMADLTPLFEKVFSDSWFSEQAGVGTVIATVGDFFCDLQFWLQEHFFKRLVTQILDRIVYTYIEALLITHKVKMSTKVKEGIAADLEVIAELADPDSGFIREATLRKRTQVVDDVRELMVVQEPNLAKKFSARYTAILEVHPDASIVRDQIVNLRTDLKKKQRQAVLEQCKKCRAPDGASASEGMFAQMKTEHADAFSGNGGGKFGGKGIGKGIGKGGGKGGGKSR
jgi:hypothetical protein